VRGRVRANIKLRIVAAHRTATGHARPVKTLHYLRHSGHSQSFVGLPFEPRSGTIMAYAVKAEVVDPRARTFTFTALKTMYGGKLIDEGDTVFIFASENEGGQGLIARGVVTHAEAIRKKRGIARQTPRVSVILKRTAIAKRPMGRRELKHLTNWNDGQPGTELNYKFYRQATNKIVGISDGAASFLGKCF
jgi:hypothetical protein